MLCSRKPITLSDLPEDIKPKAKKQVIYFLISWGFLFVILYNIPKVWENPWALTTFMFLAIATIILIFRTGFVIKELMKDNVKK